MVGCKENLNKFQNIKIIQNVFFDHRLRRKQQQKGIRKSKQPNLGNPNS